MSSSVSQLEDAVFQNMVPQLEAEGFQVFIQPSQMMLPPFLSAFRPDAVAYKDGRKIAIEVISQGAHEETKIRRARELFAAHPDWELRLVYAPPRSLENVIPTSSKNVIEEHLKRIEGSFDAMGPTAALLTAWAAFEAAARSLLPTKFGKAQTPARLLEALAFEGYITPDEADVLRQISTIRNEVAHGRLDVMPTRKQVESVVGITRTTLQLTE